MCGRTTGAKESTMPSLFGAGKAKGFVQKDVVPEPEPKDANMTEAINSFKAGRADSTWLNLRNRVPPRSNAAADDWMLILAKDLTTRDTPSPVELLDLSHNNFTRLPRTLVDHDTFRRVRTIDLRNSNICQLGPGDPY